MSLFDGIMLVMILVYKITTMKAQKDRHLEAPGEANRDKHINFLAEENGDVDPADEQFDEEEDDELNEDEEDTNITGAGNDDDLEEQENNIEDDEDAVVNDTANGNDVAEEDNGFFTDDDNSLQTQQENENDKRTQSSANEKVSPLQPDGKKTLADNISVSNMNEDILTPVKDDNNTDYTNNATQAG